MASVKLWVPSLTMGGRKEIRDSVLLASFQHPLAYLEPSLYCSNSCLKSSLLGQAWCFMHAILALEMLKQEDYESQPTRSFIQKLFSSPQVPGQVHGPEMLSRGMVPLDPVQESSSFGCHEATHPHFKHSSRKPRLLPSRGRKLGLCVEETDVNVQVRGAA